MTLRLFILSFLLLPFLGCASLDMTSTFGGVRALENEVLTSDQRVMSESQAAEIVNQALKDKNITYQTMTQSTFINNLLLRLAQASGSNVRFYARVYQDTEANAFSIGGKYVFISTGILEMFRNDHNLLAGVIGHEIAHDIAGHHHRQEQTAYWQNLAATMVKKASKNNQVVGAITNVSSTLVSLKYSRSQEKEADILGTVWAFRAGYDPLGLTRFFEKTNSVMTSNKLASLLSTHPMHPSRIETVQRVTQYLNGTLPLSQIQKIDPQMGKVLLSIQRLDSLKPKDPSVPSL